MCCKTRINVMQIKVKTIIYYFNNIYIMGRKESEKRSEKVERMKEKE